MKSYFRRIFAISPLLLVVWCFSCSRHHSANLTSFDEGVNKCQSGDYSGAIAYFNKAIEQNPQNADAYIYRGVAKSFLKDYAGVVADDTKAIELNPQDSEAYVYRGVAKNFLKDSRGAVAEDTTAIELNPEYHYAYR